MSTLIHLFIYYLLFFWNFPTFLNLVMKLSTANFWIVEQCDQSSELTRGNYCDQMDGISWISPSFVFWNIMYLRNNCCFSFFYFIHLGNEMWWPLWWTGLSASPPMIPPTGVHTSVWSPPSEHGQDLRLASAEIWPRWWGVTEMKAHCIRLLLLADLL